MPRPEGPTKHRITVYVPDQLIGIIDAYCEETLTPRHQAALTAIKLWCDIREGKLHTRKPPSQSKV